jgi:transcriptional regulator with XRE-family HTH domain
MADADPIRSLPDIPTPGETEPAPGQRLRAARYAAGLSQPALAARAGVHPVTISRIERGEMAPSYNCATKLATALGIAPGLLLPGLAVTCPHCGRRIG